MAPTTRQGSSCVRYTATMTDSRRAFEGVIRDTAADFKSMPFFVRPMVKAGLRKRTGKTIDEWKQVAAELADTTLTMAQFVSAYPGLVASLERLADNYHTAPERAGKAMKGAALERVTQQAEQREQLVRCLVDELLQR